MLVEIQQGKITTYTIHLTDREVCDLLKDNHNTIQYKVDEKNRVVFSEVGHVVQNGTTG